MEEKSRPQLICRHCHRPIAVPASRCPWCDETIMVICAVCKAYTDDQESHCEHCGSPLQPDRMERLALVAHHPEIARLAQDRERARLVASAVIVRYPGDFFFDAGAGQRSVLLEWTAAERGPRTTAVSLVLAAYAYLNQEGYCNLRLVSEGEMTRRIEIDRTRVWDGQESIEGVLVEQAERSLVTREATWNAIRKLMDFRMRRVGDRKSPFGRPRMQEVPARSASAAIDQAARLTVLPEHDRQKACSATYQSLVEFVQANRERARLLALETFDVIGALESLD